MPTPLNPIPFNVPGSLGLNKTEESTLLPPQFSTVANNAVIDKSGKLAARMGWAALTGSAISGTPNVEQVFEYVDGLGNSEIISSANKKLYHGTTTLTEVTGTITAPTTISNWKFQNFNGKCLAWPMTDATAVPAVKSTTGSGNTFADISFDALSGGSHTWGTEVLAAYGRVWTFDSTHTILKYSSLLDETDFAADDGSASSTGGTTAGVIDLKSIWVYGMDTGVAIAAFNGLIVIFGNESILLFGDSAYGSTGVDPNSSTFGLVDVIQGIGCVSKDTVRNTGTDLTFLSTTGVRSLQRVIQEKSNPMTDDSRLVKEYLQTYIDGEDADDIRAAYNKEHGFYIITFPTYSTVFCFDMRTRLQDGSRRCTTWTGVLPGGIFSAADNTLYLGDAGVIGSYTGYEDNGSSYLFEYESCWFIPHEELRNRAIILKRLGLTAYTVTSTNVAIKWAFDFKDAWDSANIFFDAATASEWGVAEYSIAEWSGGSDLRDATSPGSKSGKVLKLGIQVPIDAEFSLQELEIYFKLGRVV